MTQRTLVLIRHAKSSWANPLESDFDRPLNERGRHDAPIMGDRLKQRGVIPDIIIASPAKRTTQTARKIARSVGFDLHAIQWEEKLYHCIAPVFEEVIYRISPEVHTAFIVAHNPGITDFINQLSPGFSVDDLPTCGIVAVRFHAEEWDEFSLQPKEVWFYDYPKNED